MSNVESRAPRRGLWLMLAAWVVVLALVGAAAGFVLLERHDKAGEAQVASEESAEAAGQETDGHGQASETAEMSPDATATELEGSVEVEEGPSAEPEAPDTATAESEPDTEDTAAAPSADDSSDPAVEPEAEEDQAAQDSGTQEPETQEDVAHAEPESSEPAPARQETNQQDTHQQDTQEPHSDEAESTESAGHDTEEPSTAPPAVEETASTDDAVPAAPVDHQAADHGDAASTADSHDGATANESAHAASEDSGHAAGEEPGQAAGETQEAAVPDDGTPPWQRYAGQVKDNASGPKIAVVLTGLGLSAAATEAAIKQLPSAVTLSFSPYARRLNQWIALARVNGHEVMIDLPMEPVTFPEDDPGPHALLTFLDSKQNLRRLDWVLNRGNSFVGVAAVMGSRFAASEEDMGPVMVSLMERGLMFLDNRSSDRSVAGEIAVRLGLPHAVNDRTLDAAQASRIAINSRLTEIERLAQEKGHSIAMAQPYPVTLERLRDWAVEIEARGYSLVPITALAAKKAGG